MVFKNQVCLFHIKLVWKQPVVEQSVLITINDAGLCGIGLYSNNNDQCSVI